MSGAIPPSDERDDDELLRRLVDGQPIDGPRTPEREAYEDLIERIRDLPDLPPPAGWEDRLEAKRADHERTERRQRLLRRAVPATFAVLTAAAAVLIYVAIVDPDAKPSRTQEAKNDVVAESGSGSGVKMRSDGVVSLGDHLLFSVSRPDRYVELRVYHDDQQVFRCPGDPGCWTEPRPDRNAQARFKPARSGTYRAVVITGAKEIPAASQNIDVALDVLSAEFTVDITTYAPIDVH